MVTQSNIRDLHDYAYECIDNCISRQNHRDYGSCPEFSDLTQDEKEELVNFLIRANKYSAYEGFLDLDYDSPPKFDEMFLYGFSCADMQPFNDLIKNSIIERAEKAANEILKYEWSNYIWENNIITESYYEPAKNFA